jgi:methionine--tRNA ligase beta chain
MMNPIKETIQYDDFAKLDMRVGTVVSAEEVANSDKLVRMMVDIGEVGEDGTPKHRQILAGIKKWYPAADLVGKQIVVAANLAPRKLAGLESQGMLVAAHTEDGGAVVLSPDKQTFNGSHLS